MIPLEKSFQIPSEYAQKKDNLTSPLIMNDGTRVANKAQWQERRKEILAYWHKAMGPWPELLHNPAHTVLSAEDMGLFERQAISLAYAPHTPPMNGYLLIPKGKGPFPAILDLYYTPEPGAGIDESRRDDIDFSYKLAQQGFVALCIGTPVPIRENILYPDRQHPTLQPLSFMAYMAANCHTLLANLPYVMPERIGVIGHSMGGKWSMFAACLYEKFACAATSDPGIIFREDHVDINYWEPWYLGWEAGSQEAKGFPISAEKRTGSYKLLMAEGHNLHELHALMAPRPFFIAGGACDTPDQWVHLKHAIEVNQFLGYSNRVGMINRPLHKIDPETHKAVCDFFLHCLKEDCFGIFR
jgi:hypothetical protein